MLFIDCNAYLTRYFLCCRSFSSVIEGTEKPGKKHVPFGEYLTVSILGKNKETSIFLLFTDVSCVTSTITHAFGTTHIFRKPYKKPSQACYLSFFDIVHCEQFHGFELLRERNCIYYILLVTPPSGSRRPYRFCTKRDSLLPCRDTQN